MTHAVEQSVGLAVVSDSADVPGEEDIRQELAVLVRSRVLGDEPRLQRMLSYVVNEYLAGRADAIKAYSIAVDVFGRSSTFNPSTDAVVRIHASRLRALLDEHYRHEGRDSPVRLHLPKGSYVPKFENQRPSGCRDDGRPTHKGAKQLDATLGSNGTASIPFGVLGLLSLVLFVFSSVLWVLAPTTPKRTHSPINSIGLIPLWTHGGDARSVQSAADLSHEFVRIISASHHVILKLADPLDGATPSSGDMKSIARALDVRWLLWGSLAPNEKGEHRVILSITDGETGRVLRSNAYVNVPEGGDLAERAEGIVADLRPQFLDLSKRAVEASPLSIHSPLEQFLLLTWTSGTGVNRLEWELERVAMARSVIARHPHYGPAHAILADKLAYLANVNPPNDTADALLEAAQHAESAIELSPDMAEAVFTVSAYAWHAGRLSDSVDFAKRTLDLSPRHILARVHTLAVPYTCRSAPASILGALEDLDDEVSVSNPVRWVILSWLTRLHLNNGNYAEAVRTGRLGDQIFRTPDTIIQLAVALVASGQPDDAKHALRSQKNNWPHMDPRHYIRSTLPRRCREQGVPDPLARIYLSLIEALETR